MYVHESLGMPIPYFQQIEYSKKVMLKLIENLSHDRIKFCHLYDCEISRITSFYSRTIQRIDKTQKRR